MKNKIVSNFIYFIIISTISTAMVSCINKQPLSLKGKWRYIDLQNNYSEFWFDSDSVSITIDATSYNIYYYHYYVYNDSLFLYRNFRNSKEVDSLKIEIIDNNNLILKNKIVNIKLTRFDNSAKIDTTTVFKDRVYANFGNRLDKYLEH